MTSKYDRLLRDLDDHGIGTMRCSGNSMLPILSNPSPNTYVRQETYEVGDIVFCKVRGRYIDAHKITRKDGHGRCMISNNHGHDNGIAGIIYGRVVRGRGHPRERQALLALTVTARLSMHHQETGRKARCSQRS